MNEKQRQSIDVCSDELLEILRPGLNDSFLPYLEYRRIITSGNRLAIEGKRSDFDKMRTLFDFLKVKDQGWQGLIGFLQHEGHQFLRDRLENLARGNSSSEDSFAANSYSDKKEKISTKKQAEVLTKFQGDLVKALNPADIFLYLETNNLLTPDEKQIVDRQNTLDGAKVLQLLRVMAYKDGWWNALMDFLEIQSKFSLREELMKDMAKRT